jgi:hypothetical protein
MADEMPRLDPEAPPAVHTGEAEMPPLDTEVE